MISFRAVFYLALLFVSTRSFPLPQRSWLRNQKHFLSDIPISARGALRKGVTLDLCETSDDCEGSRECFSSRASIEPLFRVPCSAKENDCLCLPAKLEQCRQHADCDNPREICGAADFSINKYCISYVSATGLQTVAPKPNDEKRPSNSAAGKTMQICSEDFECKGDRVCSSAEKDFIVERKKCSKAIFNQFKCLCLPPTVKSCTLNADCEAGEVCGRLSWLKEKHVLCVSADMELWHSIESVSDDVPPEPADVTPSATNKPSPQPSQAPDVDMSHSPEPESSRFPDVEGTSMDADLMDPSPGVEMKQPTDMELTATEEASVEVISSGEPDTGIIPSKEPSVEITPSEDPNIPGDPSTQIETTSPSPEVQDIAQSPSATEDPICVDARALSHLHPGELVFKKHSMARVLCDQHENCATEGHIVIFKEKAMMMRSYCLTVGCSERTIPVNSPRYQRGLRVATNTEGLYFTAFAARYATRFEEAAVQVAVRAGL